MELVRGSHRWQHSLPEGQFHGPKNYRAPMEKAAAREGRRAGHRAGGRARRAAAPSITAGPGTGRATTAAASRAARWCSHAMSAEVRYATGRRSWPWDRALVLRATSGQDSDVVDENYFPIIWTQDGRRTKWLDSYLATANARRAAE